MSHFEREYTPEQIEKAKEIHKLLMQYAKISMKIDALGQAVKQTVMAANPDAFVPKESRFPLSMLMGGRSITPHPTFIERFKAARLVEEEEKDDSTIAHEVIEDMQVESLLLGSDAKRILMQVEELAQTL